MKRRYRIRPETGAADISTRGYSHAVVDTTPRGATSDDDYRVVAVFDLKSHATMFCRWLNEEL